MGCSFERVNPGFRSHRLVPRRWPPTFIRTTVFRAGIVSMISGEHHCITPRCVCPARLVLFGDGNSVRIVGAAEFDAAMKEK